LIEVFASGAVLLIADQWMKNVRARLDFGKAVSGRSLPFFCRGWGKARIQRDQLRALLVALWVWATVSVIVLHYSHGWFQSRASLAGIGLALGGAAGNLIDVWRYEGVVDFIDLKVWPVFNLADVGIVGGMLLALLN